MRSEGLQRLVLCIDESLQVSDSDLPRHAHVVRFKKRVSVADVVQAIERLSEHDDQRSVLASPELTS